MKQKAFTLIELLVVITIIAILAAIIFPVFAQAKASAKKIGAMSNMHQIGLAVVMYEGDYSDSIPLDFTSDINGANTWQDLLQPYTKSYAVMFDPVSSYQNTDHVNSNDYWASFGMLPEASAIGDGSFANFFTRTTPWLQNYVPANMNYDGAAGVGVGFLGWAGGYYNTVSGGVPSKDANAIARPAEYALVFTAGNWDGWHAVYGYQNGLGYCGGWGGPNTYFLFQPRHSGGTNTCVTATRATDYGTGVALAMFADGHTKAMSSGALLQPDQNGGGFLKYWWPNQ